MIGFLQMIAPYNHHYSSPLETWEHKSTSSPSSPPKKTKPFLILEKQIGIDRHASIKKEERKRKASQIRVTRRDPRQNNTIIEQHLATVPSLFFLSFFSFG
jgi:hypothetical protein